MQSIAGVGSSQLAYGVCEVPSMKVLTRGMMNEHSRGSANDLSPFLAFTPCYAGHRLLVNHAMCV